MPTGAPNISGDRPGELEGEGLVGRRTDPADNRCTLAALTAAGTRLAAELQERHRAYQQPLLDGVGKHEQDRVLQVLRRLRDNVAREDS
jgi:MarR family transcriptional regulator for hemolysin